MTIMFGGDYNPEQWPPSVWAEDMKLMAEAGVTLVTVGVFAWASVEPRPGEYDFGWFDRVMDNLADHGIGACLATMTASPPPWLSRLHPEVLPVRADGTRLWPGARQHYCPSSPVYREHARRLAEQVARRYAGHPALRLWHIGNEYGCHVRQCYCEVSAADFRRWLRDRYGDIDALNRAWSTAFWSQRYDDWEEINPPRTTPTFVNPAHRLDFERFSDDAILACYLSERDAVRRHSPDVPVTTNFTGLVHKPIDSFRWAAEQDVVSLDSYPDPYDPRAHVDAAFAYDLVRSAGSGRPWLLMENAPSAVNWRPRNAPKPPGLMRLWCWQAVAQGADAVLFFQWRQAAGGAEKFHSAMVPHGGPGTRTHREVRALGAELAAVPELAGTRVRADVAILHDWDSWRAVEGDAHPAPIDLLDAHRAHYAPLFDAHVTCDVVPPTADLTAYRLVVVPNLYLMTGDVGARLTRYVAGGGHLLVSFFSGIVDESERVHPGGYPAPLREVLGLHVEEFWPLDGPTHIDMGGERHEAALWSEWIDVEGARPVATFTEGPLAGRPAVTRHAYGDGVAWYLATRPAPAAMRRLMDRARADAGVRPVLPGLPPGVQAVVRHGPEHRYLFLLNHGAEPASVRLTEPAPDLLADPAEPVETVELAPRAVAVLRHPRH
ncbi:beta-galactosidase [Actinomadura sp. NBRC 104425]|uniref:beta-galactosidase n=1 Tax=Actinomadura sp. NBRC 104425 TaxID=3032204 RepID=UPI0024A10E28|nr:beta-galactosidase [Actinomadura sp. NBRC 104425]GLZ13465.1 beta-galactosidase [Actinomadura sp. NBRC 104425]